MQDDLARSKRTLDVWLTLPVSPQGLTEDGLAQLDALLAAKVRVAGVNVMTMNYGGSRPSGMSMGEASEQALLATARQVNGAHQRAGITLNSPEVWRRIGATPMIGQNDEASERFTRQDALRLRTFAERVGLGRISMWSLDRDHPCSAREQGTRVSNTCSGVSQTHWWFSQTFSALPGRAPRPTDPVAQHAVGERRSVRDDEATSPYPIWRSGKVYVEGDKVVWRQDVYQAKWWTRGDQPDRPVTHEWDSAWRYLARCSTPTCRWPTGCSLPARTGMERHSDLPGRRRRPGRRACLQGPPLEPLHTSDADPDDPWSNPWIPLPLPPASAR